MHLENVSLLLYDRLPAIISPRDMTARTAFAAIFVKLEANGIVPRAVRHEILHSFWFCAGVYFMTGPAGTTSFLVNVDIVKIFLAVTEISQGCCLLVENKSIFMALEA